MAAAVPTANSTEWSALSVGEIQTGVLRNTTAIPRLTASTVLQLLPGEQVNAGERPVPYAVSPEVLSGVDCRLPTRSGASHRGIGTVASRALITGGQVLQGSTVARLFPSGTDQRLPWTYYLARPGRVEVIGRANWAAIADGALAASPVPATLDLAGVSNQIMDSVQERQELDGRPPFRAPRTTLRWVLENHDGTDTAPEAGFTIVDEFLRTLRLRTPPIAVGPVLGRCEDLALHDWLLTTVTNLIEQSCRGPRADVVTRLRPPEVARARTLRPAAIRNRDAGKSV